MSASLKFDQREFQTTLRRLAGMSSRALPVFLNSTAKDVAEHARAMTPAADRAKIQAELGATLISQKVDKKGRTRRRYGYSPTKLVYALVNARRRRAGNPPVVGSEMERESKKLIATRLRSIGLMKAGWNAIIGKLAFAAKAAYQRVGPNVKARGEARVARDGFNPSVEMTYKVIADGAGKQIDPRVIAAAGAAFAKKQGEMVRRLEDKMKETARKAGAI